MLGKTPDDEIAKNSVIPRQELRLLEKDGHSIII